MLKETNEAITYKHLYDKKKTLSARSELTFLVGIYRLLILFEILNWSILLLLKLQIIDSLKSYTRTYMIGLYGHQKPTDKVGLLRYVSKSKQALKLESTNE